MSLKKDIIGAEVQIGSNEAQKSLVDLTQKTSALANENDRLRITQAKLKALGKENTEEYKKVTAAIAGNSKEIKANQTQMDALRKTIGLSDMTMKQLRAQATNLRRELSNMTQSADPDRWNHLNFQLKATENQIQKIGSQIGNSKETVNSLADQAKGLLPAFGWASIAAGAAWAFNKIISATDTLGTKWEATVNGMNEGLNEFFRTIATGDWSNFIDNIEEAVKRGKDYVNTLDDIEEKTRVLSVIEAESRSKELDLEEKLKNKTLSKEDRIKAGQERIALEKELAAKRTKVAQNAFDNEVSLTSQQTKLTKDQLMSLLRDLDSETKIRAQQYNTVRDTYKKGGFTERELNDNLVINKDVTDSIKAYASILRMAGNTTDEQMEKMVGSYVKLMEAQDSAKENTKKVITTVNSLLAGEEESGQKIEDKALKSAKALADFLAKDAVSQQDAINKYFHDAGEEAFDAFMKAIEDKQNITNFRLTPELKPEEDAKDPTLDYASKKFMETQAWLDIQHKAGIIGEQEYQDKLTEINRKAEEDRFRVKEQKINEAQALTNIGANFVSAMMDLELSQAGDNEEKKAQIRKKYAGMQFAVTASQIIVDTAAAVMKALAELGPIAGPIAAAIIGATGTVQLGIANAERKKMMGSKQSGGFSNTGSDSDPDGIYHKNEFIGSAPTVRNPSIRKVYNIIDLAQKQGKAERLNLPAVMASMGMLPTGSKQSGGYGSAQDGSTSPVIISGASSDPELTAALNRLSSNLERGIRASINKYGVNGLEEAMKDIENFNSKVFK